MRQYLDLLRDVLENGQGKSDPHGVGSIAVCGRQMRFDLSKGFPMMTTKKLSFKFIAYELLWFLRGDSRTDFLKEHGVTIWDEWATPEISAKMGLESGDLGRIYGPQWRHWRTTDGGEIDQIKNLIDGLKEHPDWRRHMVTAWNPEDIDKVFVAPCHGIFKCFAVNGELSLHLFQRSADVFLGVPYNIASYALLLSMIAQVVGMKTKDLVITTSDTHIYLNHFEQAKEQLAREPKALPTLKLNPEIKDIFDFKYEDFTLEGYEADPNIKAEVAI
ncbi:MAG: thymidylate synthase [Candidatus Vogelbacteria bacterium]|nr:thymidylate synthase [Candidatus Vogelbacteria bacterium]